MPAPARASRSTPSGPRVASGNTSSAPPPWSTRSAARRAGGSDTPRRTGRAFNVRMIRANSGIRNSSAFAMNDSGRDVTTPTISGSSTLEWFVTTSTGPVLGTFSAPREFRRNRSRASPSASSLTIVYSIAAARPPPAFARPPR